MGELQIGNLGLLFLVGTARRKRKMAPILLRQWDLASKAGTYWLGPPVRSEK